MEGMLMVLGGLALYSGMVAISATMAKVRPRRSGLTIL